MPKKLTNKEFLKRVREKYPNGEYEPLEEYVNNHTKIKVRHNCKKCNNHEYNVTPSNFLSGARCPSCFGKFKKSTSEYKEEIFKLVGDEYSILSEYEGNKVKIRMKHNCKKCNNNEFEMKPNSFLSGSRCPICAIAKNSLKRRKDNEKFKKEINNLVKDEYTFLEDYKGTHTKIKVRHNCNECGNYEYVVSPTSFLCGRRCPICSKKNGTLKCTLPKEDFEQKVFDLVGNEYSIIGNYINRHTKIKMQHNCKKCNNHIWEIAPSYFLRGSRCPKCFKNERKTNDEYRREIFDLVGNEYSVIGEYKNRKTNVKMRHNCKECNNHTFEMTPNSFLSGSRCPICVRKIANLKCTLPKEDFEQKVFDLVGNEYSIIGNYINRHTKVKMKHNCKECNNHIFDAHPTSFLQGTRCPKCFGTPLKTQEQFEQEVYDLVNDEYSVIGEYINTNTHIEMKHNVCGHCWLVKPNNFLKGSRCPKCAGKLQKTQEEFEKEIFDLVEDEYSVIGKYKTTSTHIEMKHNVCGYCYLVKPNNFLNGSRCPNCNNSKGEEKILKRLKQKGMNFKREFVFDDCRFENPLRFDFALFKKNSSTPYALIEYDGEAHFFEVGFGSKNKGKVKEHYENTKLRDEIKNKYCKDNKIPLLRIKYTQFKEIDTIIEHFLNNLDNYIDNHSFGMSDEEYYKNRE